MSQTPNNCITVFRHACFLHDEACDWDGLCDHLGDVAWKDIFKINVSAAASGFSKSIQVGIDVYIPHCKYQVKPHSWFSAACAAAIIHGNHFLFAQTE